MMAYASVIEINGNRLKVKLNTDNLASSIPYYHLDTYTPHLDDIVYVDVKLQCVIGKVNI